MRLRYILPFFLSASLHASALWAEDLSGDVGVVEKNGVRFTSDVASDEESGCLRALRIRLTHGFECDIPEDGLLAIYELRLPTTRRNPEVSLPPFF